MIIPYTSTAMMPNTAVPRMIWAIRFIADVTPKHREQAALWRASGRDYLFTIIQNKLTNTYSMWTMNA